MDLEIIFVALAGFTIVGTIMIFAKLCEIERHLFFLLTHLHMWIDESKENSNPLENKIIVFDEMGIGHEEEVK